jgi:replicative DNA helicase
MATRRSKRRVWMQADRCDEPPLVAGRVPPHDLDAEAAVLSASLLSADALMEAMGLLRAEHFYSDANAAIWSACSELLERAVPVDAVSVVSLLRDQEKLQRAGGAAYVGQIIDATPAVTNVLTHASIVRELCQARRMIATCQRVAAEGYGPIAPVPEWLQEAQTAVTNVCEDRAEEDRLVWIGDAARSWWQTMTTREPNVETTGLPIGLRAVREAAPMLPGYVTVIGGRPGMGKSALALGMAIDCSCADPATIGAARPIASLVHSLEMPGEDLVRRGACKLANVDLADCCARRLSSVDYVALTEATNELASIPLWIDDEPVLSAVSLRSSIRRTRRLALERGADLRLCVVDYLQLMQPSGQADSREGEIAELSRSLKILARSERIHIIVLSSLNRSCELRRPPIPQLADLRESGGIEADADNVLLLYRHDYYAASGVLPWEEGERGEAQVIVTKQRNGRTGVVRVRFYPSSTAFGDLGAAD